MTHEPVRAAARQRVAARVGGRRKKQNWIWRAWVWVHGRILAKSLYIRQPELGDGSFHSNFHRPTMGRWKLR
jgi:hypothetical protein